MAKAAQSVVSDRETSTATVVGTARRFADYTARELGKLLAPELADGEEMPDLIAIQELMASALERRLRLLITAADVLTQLEHQDTALRAWRDNAVDFLYREVGGVRKLVAGRLAPEIARTFLPLKGETSREPATLLRQADRVVDLLRNVAHSPQTANFSHAERVRYAAPVAEKADVLRRRDDQARRSAKGLDLARLDRRRALKDFNQVFIRVAGWFEHTYRAIDRDDLAEDVRPSKQYPGRTLAEVRKRAAAVKAEAAVEAAAEPEPAPPALPFDPLRHIARALGFRASPEAKRRQAGGRR